MEKDSNHPLAQAITKAAQAKGLELLETTDFQAVIGQGISATVAGKIAYLGNQQWLSRQGITITEEQDLKAQSIAKSGQTIIYLAIAGVLQGLITIKDDLRPDAVATVKQLQALELDTILLTGDRAEVAQAIAKELNITQVFSQVKPESKAQIIQSLQQEHRVAMVGDGINDAPALAQADVGISLQGSTDVAIATADIVLMQNKLQDVVKSIALSRATVTKIKQNLIWALAYNVFAIPIAAGILLPHFGLLLSPVWAAVAMASSSLIVVTNSLLLNSQVNHDLTV